MSAERSQDGGKTLIMKIQSASGLAKKDLLGTSDPYVRASLTDSGHNITHEQKTKHVKKSLNPVWNEVFTFSNVNNSKDKLLFRVFDQNRVTRDDFLGQVSLNLKDITIQHLENIEVAQKYSLPLEDKPGKHRSGVKGQIYVSLCYKPDSSISPHLGATLADESNTTRASTVSIAENGTQDDDEETLPQGWEAVKDPMGHIYYIDHNNMVTQWEHPRMTMSNYSAEIRSSVRRQFSDSPRAERKAESQDSADSSSVPTSPVVTQPPTLLEDTTNQTTEAQQPPVISTVSSSSSSARPRDTRDEANDPVLGNLSSTLATGWEARYAPNGRVFFIDHNSRPTSWAHPVTGQTYPLSLPSETTHISSPAKLQPLEIVPLAPYIRKPNAQTDHPLPAGWEMRMHKNRPLFIDHNNRATQWEDPGVFGARSVGAPPAKLDMPVRRASISPKSRGKLM